VSFVAAAGQLSKLGPRGPALVRTIISGVAQAETRRSACTCSKGVGTRHY
jgi:hypothetical protein